MGMKLIAVGKVKEKSMRALIEEYEKRIRAYTKLELIEVADEIAPETNSDAQNRQVMKKEGERLLSKIKDGDYVILLDLHGTTLSSEQLAEKINQVFTYQTSQIVFVIGGSLGLSDEVVKRANFRLKLSDMTFPHQLCRIFILEQIYRSYKILYHEPYHK